MMIFTGYPLGIAGLFRESMAPVTTDRALRVAFVAGGFTASLFLRCVVTCAMATVAIVHSDCVCRLFFPLYVISGNPRPLAALVLGSFFVAWGSFVGNGCTSGHGMAGLSRFSLRSIVFVVCMFASAIVSSGVYEALLGA